jgi:hypothetical protein
LIGKGKFGIAFSGSKVKDGRSGGIGKESQEAHLDGGASDTDGH